MNRFLLLLGLYFLMPQFSQAQHSVARQWNEALLQAIRNDFARPTVHARNLLHTSVAMYDIWAAYDNQANPYFLGNTVGNYTFDFEGLPMPDDVATARATAISYAAYRILYHRFSRSPGVEDSYPVFNELFEELGHDSSFVSTDYTSGNPAAFGNYVAEQVIAFGMQDNSNEIEDYANTYYNPFNYTLNPAIPGSGILFDPNRWQPLTFDVFIDQSGNLIPGGAPEFLSPEWGRVTPFALTPKELTIYERDFGEYWVYHDPGTPSYIDANGGLDTEDYQWGFALVSIWSSHLDPSDGVLWDISPGSIGNIDSLPKTMEGLREFYDLIEGGDPSRGHAINPHTGQPYEENIVPRADYARVLAEFWADGPDSETPPGHWFSILNYVNDHPLFEKRFRGEGPILDDLEWDVKAYLTLGGAVHDAAISAWGIKGWYDYIRPISAIRSMAGRGQSSDPNLPNYSISGLPLIDGFVEMVEAGDSLAGINNEHVGKVKVYAWRGPDYIEDEETDLAGVGWILAENWWPYQRPTFVTPPFAGYVSGHSTFSRAAAEVMTLLTGDAFFPGGMGVFECKKNEFLVFEEGPSVDLTLQWATYRDASDQTSLSRIWGGIHPPVDDVPGRVIGEKIGVAAFQHAKKYFDGLSTSIDELDEASDIHVFPNPIQAGQALNLYLSLDTGLQQVEIIDSYGKVVRSAQPINGTNTTLHHLDLPAGIYWLKLMGSRGVATKKFMVQQKD